MNPREEFLRKVNKAFADGDSDFLLNHVSEDFCWVIVGEKTVGGKIEFSEALDQMKDMPPMKIDIQNVIADKNSAIIEGIVVGKNRLGQKKYFGFCDIFQLEGAETFMIKKMTSYVVDVSKHKQYRETC
ncbi:nuclear transport factor 2 family protein [Salinimicrobium soli]|uniref:nuclear transport factor 2 family protein n=1 Tax=Salinimicrobium soli TaxID=1254399 RepID=UPI003AAD9D93